MSALTEPTIERLLEPYTSEAVRLAPRLSVYLDLLLRWNARTNLTAIRQPEEIVRRHFGESLFAAAHLADSCSTWNNPSAVGKLESTPPDSLLDLGSGAGFPGLPIALAHPQIAVTLAESQGKKASFLREAIRTLKLVNVEVFGGRAENLDRRFHTVTLRAVDEMAAALVIAGPLAEAQLVLLTTNSPALPEGFRSDISLPIPGSESGVLLRARRVVPRGTI